MSGSFCQNDRVFVGMAGFFVGMSGFCQNGRFFVGMPWGFCRNVRFPVGMYVVMSEYIFICQLLATQ